jgi:hypothetical protein
MGWPVEKPLYHVRFRLLRYDPADMMTALVALGGDYVLVVSAYTPGQTGSVKLCIASSDGLYAESVPAEGLGMHIKTVKGTW